MFNGKKLDLSQFTENKIGILPFTKKKQPIWNFRGKKNLRKTIVQSLVLSELYYNDVIYHALPDYLQKRLQSILKAAASFLVGKYAQALDDVLYLNCLPIQEQRQLYLL